MNRRANAATAAAVVIGSTLGLVLAGCALPPPEKHALGEIPTAVTTAEPEWLPQRVRSGKSIEGDPREAHFTEVRRLTDGYDVDELAFGLDSRVLVLVGRAPGSKVTQLRLIDLGTGTMAATGAGTEPALGMSVARSGNEALFVVGATGAGQLVDFSVESLFRKADRAAPAFATGNMIVSRAGLAPDGTMAFLVAKSNEGGPLSLFAAPRGGTPGTKSLATGLAEVTPAVSPDRAYVAFVREKSAADQSLVVTSVEGRSPHDLATGARFASVAFRPSGEQVVYGSDRDREAFELYASSTRAEPNAVGERLTFGGAKSVAFTTDGRQIAFTSKRAGGTFDVYVARYREEP